MVEIITGVERWCRWRPEDKLRILAELDEPGAKFVKPLRVRGFSPGTNMRGAQELRHSHSGHGAGAVPVRRRVV